MYCVKCGVKLGAGVNVCPLCQTKMLYEETDSGEKLSRYSDTFPKVKYTVQYALLGFLTAVLVAACLASLIFCLNTYGGVNWSGYVMLGCAVLWVWGVLPFWFQKRNPIIFLSADFLAAGGYLLYVCLYTGGHWFLSFAFPVTMIVWLLTCATLALFQTLGRGKLYIVGGLMIAIGGATMLIEMFEVLTFGGKMFTWSLYAVTIFGALGLFLIIAAIIPPLRHYLERRFFV